MQENDERARSISPVPYATWPSAPANAAAQAPVYPPPPEFYLSGPGRVAERGAEHAFPSPPPEHDMRVSSPADPSAPSGQQWYAPAQPSQRPGIGPVIAQAPDTP